MPKIVNNELYLELKEVFEHLHMSRTTFYRETAQRLRKYTFEGRSKPWYKKSEVVALAEGTLEANPHIIIRGLLSHWTRYAESLGLNVETINRTIEIGVPLPAEIYKWVGVPETTAFVKRCRMTFLDGVPVTVWYTAYPLVLVGQFLDEIKHDGEFDIPAALKQARSIKPVSAMDSLTAREASLVEQELLQLKRPEAVMNLQRAVYSEQGKLLWYSDMILLGSWFKPEYRYQINEE